MLKRFLNLFDKHRPGLISFHSTCYIITVEIGLKQYKVFQILFSKKDGSLFVNFPYYKHSKGLVSVVTLRGGIRLPTDVSLEPGGKVTSHLVKFAHHRDGRVHFSQTGYVRPLIKRESIPLNVAGGHIFTVQLQGLSDFEPIDPSKDLKPPTEKRTVLKFHFGDSEPAAIKIVGCWYSQVLLQNRIIGHVRGPKVACKTPAGKGYWAFLLSPPINAPMSEHMLLLTCEDIPRLDQKEKTALTFIGGFDSPGVINNLSIDTTFLALSYPASNFDELAKKLSSIDYVSELS